MSEDRGKGDYEKAIDFYKRFTSRHSTYHFSPIHKLYAEYRKWRKPRPNIKPCFVSYMKGRLKNEVMHEEYRRMSRREVRKR